MRAAPLVAVAAAIGTTTVATAITSIADRARAGAVTPAARDAGVEDGSGTPPKVTAVVPAMGPVDGCTEIVLRGTGFGSDARVEYTSSSTSGECGSAVGSNCSSAGRVVSNTEIRCNLAPPKALVSGEPLHFIVTVGSGSAQKTSEPSSVAFTPVKPATIDAVCSAAPDTASEQQLRVHGERFVVNNSAAPTVTIGDHVCAGVQLIGSNDVICYVRPADPPQKIKIELARPGDQNTPAQYSVDTMPVCGPP